jgi:FkbM family methyltransferase
VKISPQFRYINEDYELNSMGVVCRVLCEGDTAIDIGANIGLYSLLMGKLVGKTGRVYSFEPASKSFGILRKHLRLNSLCSFVEAHQILVGSEYRVEKFVEDGIKGTNRVGGSQFDGPGAIICDRQTIVLDEFVENCGRTPKLIKIDVEGFELQVLRGAEKTLKTSRCTVLCEVHPDLWKEIGYCWNDLEEFMEEIDYDIFDVSGNPTKPSVAREQLLLIPK